MNALRMSAMARAACLAVAAASGTAWASPSFRIVNPTGPTYDNLRINGVSGDGRYLVGQLENVSIFRATRWTVDGLSTTDLGLLPGRPYSSGEAISFDGSVVAGNGYLGGTFRPQAFQWTAPGGLTPVPFPSNSSFGYGESISSDGSVIAGWSNLNTTPLTQRIWRWTAATGTVLVPTLPGATSNGFDVQTTRMLSGDGRYTISGAHRFDSLTNNITYIGRLTGVGGQVPSYDPSITSISSDGRTVVGYQGDVQAPGPGRVRAGFIWTEAGGMENLGSLSPSYDCFPRFMSADASTVLGTYDGYGFIWTRATGMVDLNAYLASIGADTMGMTEMQFAGISDDGQTIAGMGRTATELYRGWVLTVPAPGTAALLTLGGLLAARRRR
ncbi:MAG: hypothetical protein IOD15_05185 [Phycisphaerales bacterium]|jgi:uncharacterized membrane protein|nr:hypothetical protein [Phycisphaerales bacterium]